MCLSGKEPMPDVIFYHSPHSTRARILKVVLSEKGAEFEARQVNVYKMHDLKPPIKGGKVMVDGGLLYIRDDRALSEISDILDDIESAYPSPPLSTDDPVGSTVQEKWLEYIDNVPIVELINGQIGVPIRSGLIAVYERRKKALERAIASMPEHEKEFDESQAFASRVLDVLKGRYDDYIISQRFFEFLNNMEAALLGRDYLSGNTPLMADFAIAVSLHSLKEAGLASMWQGGKFPRVSMFYYRFLSRPGFTEICKDKTSLPETLFFVGAGTMLGIKTRIHEAQ